MGRHLPKSVDSLMVGKVVAVPGLMSPFLTDHGLDRSPAGTLVCHFMSCQWAPDSVLDSPWTIVISQSLGPLRVIAMGLVFNP